MAKGFYISKALAIVTVILTVTAIAGIVTMVILYQTQIAKLNPTPRPTFTPSPTFPTGPPPNMRLPGDLVPERYELYLWPHFYTRIMEEVNVTSPNQTMVFTGNSTVHFHCVQSTKTIFLHSKMELALPVVKVTNRDTNEKMPVAGVKLHKDESDFLEIKVDDVLVKGGNYSLFVAFEGEMMDDLVGLYISKYNEGVPANGDNTERFLAASQMQPTDARKVFPCFDEPAMKAEFDVTIIHRRGTTALGNWGQSGSSIIDANWTFTRFHTTEKMSTYLLAFTVSEFKSTPSEHGRVEIRTYARPEAIEAGQADYAADITGKILKYYEDYFNIEFPQRKLDQFAVPDFGAGAMENWGLVTYQEPALLYEDGVSSLFDKEWVATIIAHELAHQWFGNLVTMKWWNEVWLNEGFASYLSYLAVDHVEPTWHIKDMFPVRELHAALEEDALASSEPLSSRLDAIQTPAEITQKFNVISYSKGATMLRMLADFLGERVFQAGLRMYLNAFQYGNTEQKDLWEYLQKAADEDGIRGINIATVMDTWTNQIGYPVITINTTNGEINQRQFLFNQTSESGLLWRIPIKVMSKTSEPTVVPLDTETDKKETFIAKPGEWILANINATGYFRVNYNPENWRNLLIQLETNPNPIPVISRGQLIDDAFNLARAKLVNVTLALNSTRFLRNETAYFPWDSALKNLHYFTLMFDRSEVWGPMQTYLREQVRGLYGFFQNYTDTSTVPSDHSQQHNQINAIMTACTKGLPECHAMVTRMFDNWMRNDTNSSIHANLRLVIYCQAVAAGGEKEWEFVWKMYQRSTFATERDHFRYALTCTKKIWLLNRCLEYTLDPAKIRKMDTVSTINSIADNVAGQALAWNFVRAHWTYLSQDHGGGMNPLGGLIEGVTQRFSTDFELAELKRFQADHSEEELGSASQAVEQAIERTQANIQWVKENKQTVLEWFQRETA
ncbi:alanyl (membrane) aminopeptidase-like b [Centroberyx affinis]|uniref:alanyl (membrane) aminopeptidase-like b n=1 Tax=Centroberyx affinis TaxID=166261 RepID=UPI003A5C0B08